MTKFKMSKKEVRKYKLGVATLTLTMMCEATGHQVTKEAIRAHARILPDPDREAYEAFLGMQKMMKENGIEAMGRAMRVGLYRHIHEKGGPPSTQDIVDSINNAPSREHQEAILTNMMTPVDPTNPRFTGKPRTKH